MEEFLKNKLDNYDAGFDNSAWDAIEDRVIENNGGIESLRANLKGYDAGFNQSAWKNIAGKVQQNNLAYKSKLASRRLAGVAALAVGLILSGFVGYSIFDTNLNAEEQIAETKIETQSLPVADVDNSSSNEIATETKVTEKEETIAIINKSKAPNNKLEATKVAAIKEQPKTSIVVPDIPHNEVISPSLPKLHIEKNEFCLGEALVGKVAGNTSDKYAVRIGNKWIESNSKINHTLNKPGKYDVELFAVNNRNKRQKIESKTIVVHNKVNSDFSYHKVASKEIPVTQFDVKDKNQISTSWYVGNKQIGSSPTLAYTFVNKGKYSVKLVSCNAHGCKDSSTQLVRVLKAYNLLATQVFNPEKETWLPLGLKKTDQQFDIKIIASNGSQAFHSENSNQEWNGVVSESGKTAKDGDEFYWIAKVQNSEGEVQEYAGSFIISTTIH